MNTNTTKVIKLEAKAYILDNGEKFYPNTRDNYAIVNGNGEIKTAITPLGKVALNVFGKKSTAVLVMNAEYAN